MTNEPVKRSSFDLPESLHRALKTTLAAEGKTLKDWQREAAAEYVQQHAPAPRNQPRRRPAKQ